MCKRTYSVQDELARTVGDAGRPPRSGQKHLRGELCGADGHHEVLGAARSEWAQVYREVLCIWVFIYTHNICLRSLVTQPCRTELDK